MKTPDYVVVGVQFPIVRSRDVNHVTFLSKRTFTLASVYFKRADVKRCCQKGNRWVYSYLGMECIFDTIIDALKLIQQSEICQ